MEYFREQIDEYVRQVGNNKSNVRLLMRCCVWPSAQESITSIPFNILLEIRDMQLGVVHISAVTKVVILPYRSIIQYIANNFKSSNLYSSDFAAEYNGSVFSMELRPILFSIHHTKENLICKSSD